MTIPANYRKSSASANNDNCVYIRNDLGAILNSRNPGAVLPLSREAVTALIKVVR